MFNKFHFFIGLLPLALSVAAILIIIIILRFLPAKLPLFYSVAWGEQQLATHQQFFIIPASIMLIAFLNLIIAWQLHLSQAFLKKVLAVSSVIIGFILTVSLIKIVLIFI